MPSIAAELDAWAAAFNAGDAGALTALYADTAVLWGTLSPLMLTDVTGIRRYFEQAFSAAAKPAVSLGARHVRVYGDTAINSGSYTFSLLRAGQLQIVAARFSFVYQATPDGWRIVDHHSSVMPVD